MFTLKNRSILKPTLKKQKDLFIRENEEQAIYLAQSVTEDEIINKALDIVAARLSKKSDILNNPQVAIQFFQLYFSKQSHESFCVVYLDNQHRVIDIDEFFVGTIDGVSIYPREVVKFALEKNAAAVMFAHNHPSGMAQPSEADKTITTRLKIALNTVEIKTLDHFIIGGTEHYSFAEHHLI